MSSRFQPSGEAPETTIALIPSRASRCPICPPTFDSFVPPVSGLLKPKLVRPLVVTAVPASSPGAMNSFAASPRGWMRASVSSSSIREVRARPPSSAYASGARSSVTSPVVMSTRMMRSMAMRVPAPGLTVKGRRDGYRTVAPAGRERGAFPIHVLHNPDSQTHTQGAEL